MVLVTLCGERGPTSQSEVPPPLLYKRGPPHLGGVNFAFGEALPSFAKAKVSPLPPLRGVIHPSVALSNDKDVSPLRRRPPIATCYFGHKCPRREFSLKTSPSDELLKKLEQNFYVGFATKSHSPINPNLAIEQKIPLRIDPQGYFCYPKLTDSYIGF